MDNLLIHEFVRFHNTIISQTPVHIIIQITRALTLSLSRNLVHTRAVLFRNSSYKHSPHVSLFFINAVSRFYKSTADKYTAR